MFSSDSAVHQAPDRAMARWLWALLAFVPLCLSCTVTTGLGGFRTQPVWGGPAGAGHSRFNQSCGVACGAPVNASTGELVAPAAPQMTSAMVEEVARTVAVGQAVLSIQRILTEAEMVEAESIIRECVAQAHADINESYQRESGDRFENGMFPTDAECNREVGFDRWGRPVSLAQRLGALKHDAAFACIKAHMPERFRGNFSIESRYKKPDMDGAVLTNNKPESLQPDVVIHATRNATAVQCVYEIKFPCLENYRLEPMGSPDTVMQLKKYMRLSLNCRVMLVTQNGLYPYGGAP